MISPEDVRLEAMPFYFLCERDLLPNVPCVYFAVNMSGEILYIGQTQNLKERWRSHDALTLSKDLFGVHSLTMHDRDERLKLERVLIKRLKPPLNVQYMKP